MNKEALENLLSQVANGNVTPAEAVLQLKAAPFQDIGFAKIDTHRTLRQGTGEIIYGAGKTAKQIEAISTVMLKNGQDNILITRLNTEKATLLKEVLPLNYDEIAQIGIIGTKRKADGLGKIVIATGDK